MAVSRLSQASAVQGAEEEREGDVQRSTSTAPRSPQRSNAGASSDELSSSAAQADRTVRKSGKKAVILSGGKQYLVSEGQELEVDLLDPAQGEAFEVLAVIDGAKIDIGKPTVAGASVKADILEQIVKGDKVTAIRYKAKKRVHKRRGHRQQYTRIKITKITAQ